MILMIFSTVRAPPRPGLHGRVVGHQADPSPLEAGQPGDDPIGRQRVGQRVGEHPVLDERAFIDQPGDPLADEQLALGGIGLVKAACKGAFDHGQVGAFQAPCPPPGIESVDVIGIAVDTSIGLANGFIGQAKDAVARLGVFGGGMAPGEEAVVGVEGGVEQVEPVELLEKKGIEQQR